MKKTALILALATSCVLTACGAKKTSTEEMNNNVVEETGAESNEELEGETLEEQMRVALEEGKNYYFGFDGKEKDKEKAEEAFLKATEGDSAEAWYYLGEIYDEDKKYVEEMSAYEKSIGLGFSLAKVGLADMYISGKGTDLNYNKARELYESALEDGCIEGNIGIAELCLKGNGGLEKDTNKAIELVEEVVNDGNDLEWKQNALEWLMAVYTGYYDGVDTDVSKISEYALKYEEVSKQINDDEYTGVIGISYDYAGEYDTAIDWYEKNDTKASLHQLGCMYYYGYGVEQDYTKAKENFEKAANLGNTVSMGWMGLFFQEGIETERNIDTAIEWYEKQATAGDGSGYSKIGNLYASGNGVTQDYDKAFEYALKGAELGDTSSMKNVAICYKNGYGTGVDLDKACEYFAKAIYYGDDTASDSIIEMLNNGSITEETANKWMDYYYNN